MRRSSGGRERNESGESGDGIIVPMVVVVAI